MNKIVKCIIAISAIFIVSVVIAQNAPVKSTGKPSVQKFEYCRLMRETNWNSYTGGNTTQKTWVQFNYNGDSIYKEDKATIDTLNNIMDGLNYLGSLGWELVATYVTEGDGWVMEYYILKRKK